VVIRMIYYEDKKYKFYELFNEKNGTLVRSNIIGTSFDATMRSYPELIDIGIMGKCHAAQTGICSLSGVECYQNAINSSKTNMLLEDYESILRQSKNKVFQVALGGAGDPNKHEYFDEILSMTREYGIIPNMTTSGYNLSDREVDSIKKYCGAVAVSFYSRLKGNREEGENDVTINAIERFTSAGCITNVHYVVSDASIEEAIYRLENDCWPEKISAIIFILYKPVGLGKREKVVKYDVRLQRFLDMALKKKHSFRIGFDTCFTSALVGYQDYIDKTSIDACEAARFSMYIDSEMNAYPCSFDNQAGKYRVSLRDKTIVDAWNSAEFEQFREVRKAKCNGCTKVDLCNYGCGLDLGIDLC